MNESVWVLYYHTDHIPDTTNWIPRKWQKTQLLNNENSTLNSGLDYGSKCYHLSAEQ